MAQTEQPITPTQSPVAKPHYVGRVFKAPPKPASVTINVEGAFIVNDETVNKNGASEFVHWEHKDIRLPHHTDVVSHVAIDVSLPKYDEVAGLTHIDWGITGKACLLLPRTRIYCRRRSP